MADQPGITNPLIQPELPDFGIIPPILLGLSERERIEARIGRIEQMVQGMMQYLGEQRRALASAHDLLTLRINEFLVERQETETTIAQWTGNQNNLDVGPGGGIAFRFSTDASRDITGMLAPGLDGLFRRFINVGSNDGVIKNQAANSDAVNRFLNDTGADITVSADENLAADLLSGLMGSVD